jgi:hypothetical protein
MIPFMMEPTAEQLGVNRVLSRDHPEVPSIPFAE